VPNACLSALDTSAATTGPQLATWLFCYLIIPDRNRFNQHACMKHVPSLFTLGGPTQPSLSRLAHNVKRSENYERQSLPALFRFGFTRFCADRAEELRSAEIAFAEALADRDANNFFSFVAGDAQFLGRCNTMLGKQAGIGGLVRILHISSRTFPLAAGTRRNKCHWRPAILKWSDFRRSRGADRHLHFHIGETAG
jgi:hypothetical protein